MVSYFARVAQSSSRTSTSTKSTKHRFISTRRVTVKEVKGEGSMDTRSTTGTRLGGASPVDTFHVSAVKAVPAKVKHNIPRLTGFNGECRFKAPFAWLIGDPYSYTGADKA
eukprot:CAMPEP_0178494098 /NCGR_PEP_ID=MMETSP0696-20121128/12834_1 /TAXON_ID=265572 /ORGANISM="Extubocellulus spinifer, Strain CCMP396" /LENGTH=110 /DNA_ID=CAMNT_0020122155 /DNA_START=126 /DNA_END=458 /DNA_ORIENTATION=+